MANATDRLSLTLERFYSVSERLREFNLNYDEKDSEDLFDAKSVVSRLDASLDMMRYYGRLIQKFSPEVSDFESVRQALDEIDRLDAPERTKAIIEKALRDGLMAVTDEAKALCREMIIWGESAFQHSDLQKALVAHRIDVKTPK